MNEIWIAFLQDAFFAALAGTGFAMLSNPPVKTIFIAAFLAAFAHGVRYLLIHMFGIDIVIGTLVVSFGVGLLSIPLAHLVHSPPDVFSFPSLLPMIPGMLAYKTILGLIKFISVADASSSDLVLLETVHSGLKATFILMSLAIGVSLPMLILGRQSVKGTRISVLLQKAKTRKIKH